MMRVFIPVRVVSLCPLENKRLLLNKIGPWLITFYLVLSVFSIAGQSIMLGVIAFFIFACSLFGKSVLYEAKSNDFVWLLIPAAYLFSLTYSSDFYRGWHQWLNLAPVCILLPLFYLINDRLKTRKLEIIYIVAIIINAVLHLFYNSRLSEPNTIKLLFHSSSQNSWLLWSASVLAIISIDKEVWRKISVCFLLIVLLWLYDLSKIFSILILYIVFERFVRLISISKLVVDLALVIPLIGVVGVSLVPGFKEAILKMMEQLTHSRLELEYSFNQWFQHPINGVGAGDYIHAMWNEYNIHHLQVPDKAKHQILHCMVSTGLLALASFFIIGKKYIKEPRAISVIGFYSLILLIFFAPFTSQVSAGAFILPVIFVRLIYSER